jgi:hypothetical protein
LRRGSLKEIAKRADRLANFRSARRTRFLYIRPKGKIGMIRNKLTEDRAFFNL